MQKMIDSATLDPATLVDRPATRSGNRLVALASQLFAVMRSGAGALQARRAYPPVMRTPGARPLLPPQFIDELRGRD